MNASFAEILDIAVARRQAGEPIAKIVADYPAHADELRAALETVAALDTLFAVEMPSAAEMATDRRQFLQAVENSSVPVVSLGVVERLKQWIGQKFPKKTSNLQAKKEKQPMIGSLIFKTSLIFAMVFGSAGGAAVAAAQSLPGSPLYPVKLAAEETRLQLVNDATAEALLHLNYAQERVDEMVQLAQNGQAVDETVISRWQEHVNTALQLAETSPEAARQAILTRAQETLQQQWQDLAQIEAENTAQQALQQAQMEVEQAQEQVQNELKNAEQHSPDGQFQNGMPVSPIATPHPTEMPTAMPHPTEHPTEMPTAMPYPTEHPTEMPTVMPHPTEHPTEMPTVMPHPTEHPTEMPTVMPHPTEHPTEMPTAMPHPTEHPTEMPTAMPHPTEYPTEMPTAMPYPTEHPTEMPTAMPHPTEMPGMPGSGGGWHN